MNSELFDMDQKIFPKIQNSNLNSLARKKWGDLTAAIGSTVNLLVRTASIARHEVHLADTHSYFQHSEIQYFDKS